MGSSSLCTCMLSCFSHVQLFVSLWTVVFRAHLFSRQECWSGLPCPPPGDLPNPGMKPTSLIFPALAGGFFTTEPLGKSVVYINNFFFLFYCWITLQSTNILWLVYPLHLLDYWAVPSLGLIWIILLWTFRYKSYCGNIFLCFLGENLLVE